MADSAAAAAVGFLMKEIWQVLKREINYFCCFNNNVGSFREQVKKLEDERKEVQDKVDVALRNAKRIVPTVGTWLEEATKLQVKIAEIEADIPNQKGCLNMLSRFSFSKKAKETAEAIEKFRQDSKLDTISEDAPPPSVDPFPLRHLISFLSRKQIEDEIVNALSVSKVNVVGITGMGGVGKTTMAEKIMHRMKEENLVHEIVKVVVSQPIDILKIQRDIAEYIGNKELKAVESQLARAQKLRKSLTRGKKILIILDDIWEEFKLEDIGIPCVSGSNECITLLTSRDRGVLGQMEAEVYAVETLCEDEAWTLFMSTIGTCVDNPDLPSTPRDIVKECKGLPIAIIAIGKSLKDKPKETWDDALRQLKRSRPDNLPKILHDVYMPLKVSYDSLKGKDQRSLFLLCCLFPEDFLISLEELTSYSFGLGMFEVDNLEETRNRVFAVVEELKSRFLLLDGEDRNTVKMHDVVRDVANFIASEEGKIDSKILSKVESDIRCEWISMFRSSTYESFEDLRGCNFPNLGLLCMQPTSDYETLNIDDLTFLESMQKLNVLSLRNIIFKLPPQPIESLRKLRTLQLVGCNLESISLVGELLNLEILNCSKCEEIKELPVEIRRLKCLKLLDISWCRTLQKIEPGIISELIKLEELKMLESFNGWKWTKVNEEQSINASVKEIEQLQKLTYLEIEIEDMKLAEKEINLPKRIAKYKILIGGKQYSSFDNEIYENDRVVRLIGVSREIQFGSWIHKVVRTTEALHLDGDGSANIDLLQVYKSIKILVITNCETMKELFFTGETEKIDGNSNDMIKFSKLVKLSLNSLPNLTSLVRGTKSIEFPLLEDLAIEDCKNFKTVISYKESAHCRDPNNESLHLFCNPKVAFNGLFNLYIEGYDHVSKIWCQHTPIYFFTTLTNLSVVGCHEMESLFSYCIVENPVNCSKMEQMNAMDEINKITHLIPFHKLEGLKLWNLPNLISLGKGIELMEFPLLTSLDILSCSNLTTIVSPNHTHADDANNTSLPLLCGEKVKFSRLKTLLISGCNGVGSLFSSPTDENHNLVNLDSLRIENCNKMEQLVIAMEANKSHLITFPKLGTLILEDMPNLSNLGKGIEIMEFPMLTSLRLTTCPNLTTIVSSQQHWEDGQYIDNANNDSLPSLFDEKVKFCQLEKLGLIRCNNIGSLFSSSIAESLVSIKELTVDDCNNIERIVANEQVMHETHVLFPRLVNLVLITLPSMKMLCEWRCALQLPSLEWIYVEKCPSLEFLTPGLVKAPTLKELEIDCKKFSKEELHGMEDLNGFLHRHIMSTRKASSISSTAMDCEEISEEEIGSET